MVRAAVSPVLLFSRDPVALDATACKLIDFNPEYVHTSMPEEKSGLGTPFHVNEPQSPNIVFS
jgi:uncharacterized protein (DUF362 family)